MNDEAKNGDLKNGDLKNGDLKNGDLKNGDLKNGDLKNGDLKVGSAKSKPSMSWAGYRVRLLRDLSTKGGHIFLAGTEMTVLKCFKGLDLVDDGGRRINRVQKFEVTIVRKV